MTPNTDIINAVKQLDYNVTVGDVAVATGVNIQTVENDLLFLATESGAHLQVSEVGDIVYRFPANIQGILQRKYWQLRVRALWRQLWTILFFIIRISVGLMLIASIVIVALAIAVVIIGIQISAQSQSSDSDRDRGSSSPISSYQLNIFLLGLVRVLHFNYFSGARQLRRRSSPYRSAPSSVPSSQQKETPPLNWLEAIFSFYFGDGDPNAHLEEDRWHLIGEVIRHNQGAIAAEQVAPYLDDIDRAIQLEEEDYILPVLSRFNGRPTVTDSGNLVYQFSDLQVTAEAVSDPNNSYEGGSAVSSRSSFGGRLPNVLPEKPWAFSQATAGQMMMAAGLGIANIAGIIWLGLLPDADPSTPFYAAYQFAEQIYVGLLAYGLMLGIVPIIRFITTQVRNGGIKQRNQSRETRSQLLQNPPAPLVQKLNEVRQFAQRRIQADASVAYTTTKDLTEQDSERSEIFDQEWQQRVERDRSNPSMQGDSHSAE